MRLDFCALGRGFWSISLFRVEINYTFFHFALHLFVSKQHFSPPSPPPTYTQQEWRKIHRTALYVLSKVMAQDQRDSTAGRVFPLNVADLGLIPSIPNGPPSPPGEIHEHRARHKSWAQPAVVPKLKKTKESHWYPPALPTQREAPWVAPCMEVHFPHSRTSQSLQRKIQELRRKHGTFPWADPGWTDLKMLTSRNQRPPFLFPLILMTSRRHCFWFPVLVYFRQVPSDGQCGDPIRAGAVASDILSPDTLGSFHMPGPRLVGLSHAKTKTQRRPFWSRDVHIWHHGSWDYMKETQAGLGRPWLLGD